MEFVRVTSGFYLLLSGYYLISATTTTPPAQTTQTTTQSQNGIDTNSPIAQTHTTAATTMDKLTSPPSCPEKPCQNNGTCDNMKECQCPPDFTGEWCEWSTKCAVGACDVNGTDKCERQLLSTNDECTCKANWTGTTCDMPMYCPDDYCDAYGTLNCSVVTKNSFNCHCKEHATGATCSEFDICFSNQTNTCKNEGRCHVDNTTTSGYRCECTKTGSVLPGENCQLNEVKECILKPPKNYSNFVTCMDTTKSYHMVCKIGFNGTGCARQISLADRCDRYQSNDTCKNQGYCKPLCEVPECNVVSNCNFSVMPVFNSSACQDAFADGYSNRECEGKENLFDGFDQFRSNVTDCSPFFHTVCMKKFGDGSCDQQCNNSECMFDGGDCEPHALQRQLNGSVVIDFTELPPIDTDLVRTKLSLLTRSLLVLDKKDDNSLELLAPDNYHFESIEIFGQFMSAAVAKLPCFPDACVLTHVTNVFVCQPNYYVNNERTGCTEVCSSQCTGSGSGARLCEGANGKCYGPCKPGYRGPMCDITCPAQCRNCNKNLDHSVTCTECHPGRYGPDCEKECDVNCYNSCNMTGHCLCKTGFFWDTNRCRECEKGCDGTCDDSNGDCSCKPGYYGNQCDKTCSNCISNSCEASGVCIGGCLPGWSQELCDHPCPVNCELCDRTDRNCLGRCKPGYTGDNCLEKEPVKQEKNNLGVILAIIISIIIIALIVLISWCYWRKKQTGEYTTSEPEYITPVKDEPARAEAAVSSNMIPAESHDLIDMDDIRPMTVVYAGPDKAGLESEALLQNDHDDHRVVQPDITIEPSTLPAGSMPSVRMIDETDDEADKLGTSKPDENKEGDEDDGTPEPPKSPTSPSEPTSPTGTDFRRTSFKTQVSITVQKDGKMEFETSTDVDKPPQSPLSRTLAPLASEEDLLSNIGPPKVPDNSPPVSDGEDAADDKKSQRSRSSSSSSSKSKSGSSEDEKKESEELTEM